MAQRGRPPKNRNTDQEFVSQSVVGNMEEGLSAQQIFLRRHAERMKLKFPKSEHRTGADVGRDPLYLIMPDLGIQYALGRPGYCMGKIMCVMAEEGAGKTSKCMSMINQAVEQGGLATTIEWERVSSREHLHSYVKRPDLVAWDRPDTLDDGINMIHDTLRQYDEADPEGKIVKIIIGDSLGGSVDSDSLEEDHEVGTTRPGGTHAKILSEEIPKINLMAEKTNTLVVFVNQARVIIDVGFGGAPKPWYEKVTAKGGKAVPFAACYWEILKRNGMVTTGTGEGKTKDGFSATSFFKKNKMNFPFREYKFDVLWGRDFDYCPHTMDMLALGSVCGMKVKARRYWCPDIGVSETSKLNDEEMYNLIHTTPEIMERFQLELGIIGETKNTSTDENSQVQEANAETVGA